MAAARKQNSDPRGSDTLMLAYLCIRDVEGLGERVSILDRFGLNDSDLASVCGVGEQAIRDARYKLKKRSTKGSKSESKGRKGR
jgi:hypothetical protein